MSKKSVVLICSGSLSDYLIYGEILERYSALFSAVFEVGTLPNYGKKRIFHKILKAPFGHQLINILTTLVYKSFLWFRRDPLEEVATRNGIKYERNKTVDAEFLKSLQALNSDFIFHSSSNIIGDEFLAVPVLGVINVHCAPLPEYRGAANYL